MNSRIRYAALAVLFLATSSAWAAATVTYVNPDKMSDVPRNKGDRESMEAQLLEHFNKLAARLPAGQSLKVEILDIDLAGDVFPRVAIQDVRVMKGSADWPRIHLRFSVEQDGKVLSSGERQLSDMNYLMTSNRYKGEVLGHEKQMLDDWFRKEFPAGR